MGIRSQALGDFGGRASPFLSHNNQRLISCFLKGYEVSIIVKSKFILNKLIYLNDSFTYI